ncbi:MAG: terminase, partial [Clostridiales bacterium]|nr:terminase [Clostridiales bacterium]
MKLAYLWQDENKIDWIETFIQIADKEGNIVPFILTEEQRYFVENLDKDNIVLKSRQLGLSSITIALSIRACIVQDNTTCVLISHNQTSTNSIFAKLKQQFFS